MVEALVVVGLAAATFASTSFDNFTLLLGFLSNEAYRRRAVVLGYAVSSVIMVLLAFVAAEAVEFAPARYVRYLGLVPLGLGLVGVYRLVRPATTDTHGATALRGGGGFVPVLIVMLANSADTFSVFVSLLADTREGLEIYALLAVPVLALLWSGLALWLLGKERIARTIHRIAGALLPFVLVLIGWYIFSNSPTDLVP
jgi:cadmium resistance protein CadD (predicted permease)